MTNTHSQDTQSEVYDDEEYEGEGNYELDSEPPMLVPVENSHAGGTGHRPEGGIGSGGGTQSNFVGVEGGRPGS